MTAEPSRMNAIGSNTASIKEEAIDSSDIIKRDFANADVKNEPADVEVKKEIEIEWSPDTMKHELDIEKTVLQPPDPLYVPQPSKREPADASLIMEKDPLASATSLVRSEHLKAPPPLTAAPTRRSEPLQAPPPLLAAPTRRSETLQAAATTTERRLRASKRASPSSITSGEEERLETSPDQPAALKIPDLRPEPEPVPAAATGSLPLPDMTVGEDVIETVDLFGADWSDYTPSKLKTRESSVLQFDYFWRRRTARNFTRSYVETKKSRTPAKKRLMAATSLTGKGESSPEVSGASPTAPEVTGTEESYRGQKKVRSTLYQLGVLVEQLEANRALACGIVTGASGYQAHDRMWEELAKKVSEHGPEKTAKQCKSSWRDLKRKVMRKNATISQEGQQGPGAGGAQHPGPGTGGAHLTGLELKVLSIMGPQSSLGVGEDESGLELEESIHAVDQTRVKMSDSYEALDVHQQEVEPTNGYAPRRARVEMFQIANVESQASPPLPSTEQNERTEEDGIDEQAPIGRTAGQRRPLEGPTFAAKAKKKMNLMDMEDVAVRYAKLQEQNNTVLANVAASLKRFTSAQEGLAETARQRNRIMAQRNQIKLFEIKMLMASSREGQLNIEEELARLQRLAD